MIDKSHPFFPVMFFNDIQGQNPEYIQNALVGMTNDEVMYLLSYAKEMYAGIPLEQIGLKNLSECLHLAFPAHFKGDEKSFMDMLLEI